MRLAQVRIGAYVHCIYYILLLQLLLLCNVDLVLLPLSASPTMCALTQTKGNDSSDSGSFQVLFGVECMSRGKAYEN